MKPAPMLNRVVPPWPRTPIEMLQVPEQFSTLNVLSTCRLTETGRAT